MNYIAITGALHGLGQDKDRPHFPTNLVGDFGGGSTYLVIGILAALLEARHQRPGPGRRRRHRRRHRPPQRDGRRLPRRRPPPGASGPATCSTAARRTTTSTRPPTASTCRSGALEPQFYERVRRPARHPDRAPDRNDLAAHRRAARGDRRGLRDPHPGGVGRGLRGHRRVRGRRSSRSPRPSSTRTWPPAGCSSSTTGVTQPAPAPRFSRTAGHARARPRRPRAGAHTREALAAWGIDDVASLLASGAAVQT